MGWSLLIGPQFLRQDFRQDLPLADLLKTYPLRGWQLALGRTARAGGGLDRRPVVSPDPRRRAVRAIGGEPLWVAGLAGNGFRCRARHPHAQLDHAADTQRGDVAVPGVVPGAKGGGQGIEVMGQRLIFMIGQLIVFIVALAPAAALFAGVFFLVKWLSAWPSPSRWRRSPRPRPGRRSAAGVMLLGWLFERFDVSGELSR